MNNAVSIITDLDGLKIVLIDDICFRSRRSINWKEVEQSLKEYIGKSLEIVETSEKICIGSDFPDEFSYSNDTKGLKGANIKAKANITSAIGELIQIATNKAEYLTLITNMEQRPSLDGIDITQGLEFLFTVKKEH